MHSLKILPLSPPPRVAPASLFAISDCGSFPPPRAPPSVPSASQPAAAFVPCVVSLPSQSPHPARRYRGSCVMAGVRNVQRSFVGVV